MQDGTFEVGDALEVDDQCAAGDDCALKALQLRGTLLDPEADSDAPGEAKVHAAATRRHHHHPDIRDLDPHLKKEYVEKINDLAVNISSMDLKMAYISEDLESAKLKLYGVPNAPEGVHGTVVDWSKHPGAWVPSFGLSEGVEPGTGAAADDAEWSEAEEFDDDDDRPAIVQENSRLPSTPPWMSRVRSPRKTRLVFAHRTRSAAERRQHPYHSAPWLRPLSEMTASLWSPMIWSRFLGECFLVLAWPRQEQV